jgi:hypothetical protein
LANEGFLYLWWPLAGIGIILAIYLLYRVFVAVVPPSIQRWQQPFLGFLGACAAIVVFTMYLPAKAYLSYERALSAIQSGATEKVEGPVTDFAPYDGSRRSFESFTVCRKHFVYDPNAIEPGFRQTQFSGSPIQDGVPIRLTYIGSMIVRLEVCQEALRQLC